MLEVLGFDNTGKTPRPLTPSRLKELQASGTFNEAGEWITQYVQAHNWARSQIDLTKCANCGRKRSWRNPIEAACIDHSDYWNIESYLPLCKWKCHPAWDTEHTLRYDDLALTDIRGERFYRLHKTGHQKKLRQCECGEEYEYESFATRAVWNEKCPSCAWNEKHPDSGDPELDRAAAWVFARRRARLRAPR